MKGSHKASLLAAVCCLVSIPAYAQVKQFDIPAQDASGAIRMLGRQANIQILAARGFTNGKRTNPVRGTMTVEAALRALLSGTGLVAQRSGPDTYVVVAEQVKSDRGGALPSQQLASSRAYSAAAPAPAVVIGSGSGDLQQDSVLSDKPSEIVVTGIRASQRASLELKRAAPVIVDAITATEAGKFPDANIADSLQRITGVSIQRNNGEGQYINVRGFGPQYNNVLVNGRTMATGTKGREFDFGSLSSGLISRAEVYKTYQPQLQEGGIGATVNITTARPLDGKTGVHIAAHGGGVYDLLSKQATPDLGAVVSYKNADATFGVEASLNYTHRKSFSDSARTGGWFAVAPNSNTVSIINGTPQSTGLTPAAYGYLNAGGTKDLYIPQDFQVWRSTIDSKRWTGNVTAQAQPNDRLLITLDGLYSNYKLGRVDRLYKSFFVQPYFSDMTFDENGTVTHFTRPGRDFFAANPLLAADPRSVPQQSDNVVNADRQTIETYQFGGNFKWDASDRLKFETDLSTSRANFDDIGPGIVIGNYLNGTVNFDLVPGQTIPSLTRADNVTASQLTNHFTWIVGNKYKDDITEARVQGEWKTSWSILDAVQFGGLYSRRVKTAAYYQTGGANYCAYCGYATPVDTSLVSPYSLTNWLPNASGSNKVISNFYTFDPYQIVAYQSQAATLNARPADEQAALSTQDFLASGGYTAIAQAGQGFDVSERVVAGYVNAILRGDGWSANAGVRVSKTITESSGMVQPVTAIYPNPNDSSLLLFTYGPTTPITIKNDYVDVLPSANLKIDATRDLVLRLAVSKTLTRPTLSDLGPSNAYAGRVTQPLSSGGNPFLRPFTSWNFDASIEYYPTRDIAVTADVYRKNFSGFLSNQTIIVPRTGTDVSGNPTVYNFYDTRPRNGNSGSVTGAEIAGQYVFPSHGIFSGFGIGANYTYVTSDQKVATPGDCTQIEGLSRHNYNATLFYEKFGIQARGAYNWRSSYLAVCRGLQGKPQNADPYGQFDASIAYNINENVQIFLEGVNLNNAYNYQYSVYHNRLLLDESTGRRLLFGVRLRL